MTGIIEEHLEKIAKQLQRLADIQENIIIRQDKDRMAQDLKEQATAKEYMKALDRRMKDMRHLTFLERLRNEITWAREDYFEKALLLAGGDHYKMKLEQDACHTIIARVVMRLIKNEWDERTTKLALEGYGETVAGLRAMMDMTKECGLEL